MENKFMGTREAAEKWGVPQDRVRRWCENGKIKEAEQDFEGSPWRIPADTLNPFRK